MEQVYNASAFPHASNKIHLKSYFSEFKDLGAAFMGKSFSEQAFTIRQKIRLATMGAGTTPTDWKEWFMQNEDLAEEHNLVVENENPPVTVESFDTEDNFIETLDKFRVPDEIASNLKTLQALKKVTKEERVNALANPNDTWLECKPPIPKKLKPKFLHKQIVVTVRVYKSLKAINGEKPQTPSIKYSQEIELLGSHTLAELRDSLKCPEDFMNPNDQSENAYFKKLIHMDKNAIQKNLFKSGCLYIEGCFYNDCRSEDNIDYSEPLMTWSNHPSVNIGPMKQAKMEDTKIEDLELRFNYPYVYIHQGHHEHLITFTNARLLSFEDHQLPNKYPYERSIGNYHVKVCNVCEKRLVKWFTTNNERAPEDPFYFCDVCFKSFNYDKHGNKMCDFKAYNFVHQASL